MLRACASSFLGEITALTLSYLETLGIKDWLSNSRNGKSEGDRYMGTDCYCPAACRELHHPGYTIRQQNLLHPA